MDEAAQCATLDRIWVPPAVRPPLGRRSIVTGTAYFLLFGATRSGNGTSDACGDDHVTVLICIEVFCLVKHMLIRAEPQVA
jgi:hypothetical protein